MLLKQLDIFIIQKIFLASTIMYFSISILKSYKHVFEIMNRIFEIFYATYDSSFLNIKVVIWKHFWYFNIIKAKY